jgi:hypothetical protein
MNYLPRLSANHNPPISAFQEVRITGVSHQLSALEVLFMNINFEVISEKQRNWIQKSTSPAQRK